MERAIGALSADHADSVSPTELTINEKFQVDENLFSNSISCPCSSSTDNNQTDDKDQPSTVPRRKMSSLDAMHFPYGPPFPQRRGKGYPNLPGHVFQPTKSEYHNRRMEILYSPMKDHYVRCDDFEDKIIQGFDNLCYAEYNFSRVLDEDSNLAYIGRKQFSDNAHARMDWRFDLTRVGLQVRSLQIRFPTQSFHEGYVNIAFYGQQSDGEMDHVDISEASSDYLEVPEAVGWREFVLCAEVFNEVGNGSVSQLFRQTLDKEAQDRDTLYPFRLVMEFDDCESLQYQC